MVRLKNRYLLIDILYPDPATWPTPKSTPQNPSLAIHSPTSDALTAGFLAKMIRESVDELYGDWGIGKLGGASAGGIQSKSLLRLSQSSKKTPQFRPSNLTIPSKIPLPGNINSNNPLSARLVPSRLVSSHIHVWCAGTIECAEARDRP
jgi:hypothetical protein